MAASIAPPVKAILIDLQTFGGLLVACAQSAVAQVQQIFARLGFDRAAVIGRMLAASSHSIRKSHLEGDAAGSAARYRAAVARMASASVAICSATPY
jgi:hypothetical protein